MAFLISGPPPRLFPRARRATTTRRPPPAMTLLSSQRAPAPEPPVSIAAGRDPAQMRIAEVLQAALSRGHLSEAHPSAVFYDLTFFRQRCRSLLTTFPPAAVHCFAVKACPLVAVLRAACAAGLGAECASIGEVHVSLAAGVPPSRIVFNAPVKPEPHLRFALEKGVLVNADNLDEVARIARLRDQTPSKSQIGLRINPQSGSGTIAETFVASATSKFGVPLKERRQDIIDAFRTYPFLSALHLHIGSQGVALHALADGLAAGVALADEINKRLGRRQITTIDMGGGLPVNYTSDALGPSFESYHDILRARVPRLFDYGLVTEFGRALIVKTGWVAAKVLHIKRAGGRTIALTHVGADIFMRPVYQPDKWAHRIDAYTENGLPKRADASSTTKIDLGGPLCFSGDILAVDRDMPLLQVGDWIVVRDAGGYTLSMYSRHTSQLVPAVYGYEEDAPAELQVLKKAETPQDLVKFWGDGN